MSSAPASKAQTPTRTSLTVEWVFSDEGRRIASLPSHVWLSDGKLMLYDARRPLAQRAFEILAPATGARRTALDAAAAHASLNALRPNSESKQALSWPDEFDPAGRRAIYVFNGDLFLLDLGTARFSRLTRTDAEERSPGFSPDGHRLAYVRANDLYVLDLETQAETR